MPYTTNPDDGVRIFYEVEGEGPPIAFGHGSPISGKSWRDFGYVDALKDRYQLILIDARGHGQSDKPHEPAAYVMSRRMSDLIAILDELGLDQAHYCGYSYGCDPGFFLGRFAPEHLASSIILGSHALDLAPDDDPGSHLRDGVEASVVAAEQAHGSFPPELRSVMLANDADALIACRVGEQLQSEPRSGEFADLTMPSVQEGLSPDEDLPKMNLPFLIVVGDQDNAHEKARLTADALPNAEFVEIEGIDHLGYLTHSELVLPHMEAFLRQSVAAAN